MMAVHFLRAAAPPHILDHALVFAPASRFFLHRATTQGLTHDLAQYADQLARLVLRELPLKVPRPAPRFTGEREENPVFCG